MPLLKPGPWRPALRPLNLLYVEDNQDLRESISLLLESDARHVVTCASAEEALDLMAQQAFDLLVTDVSLPGMSGTDLARRWLAPDPQRWVVLCSGYDFGDKLRVLGPNVRSLPKAFEMDRLESLLSEIDTAVRAAHPH